jgi:hypothetical protein
VKRSGRPGRWVTASSGEGEAVDKQPGQRQRQSQQHPAPQPCREKHPHAPRPFSSVFPVRKPPPAAGGSFARLLRCVQRPAGQRLCGSRAAGACLPALPAVWRHNHYGGVWLPWRNINALGCGVSWRADRAGSPGRRFRRFPALLTRQGPIQVWSFAVGPRHRASRTRIRVLARWICGSFGPKIEKVGDQGGRCRRSKEQSHARPD